MRKRRMKSKTKFSKVSALSYKVLKYMGSWNWWIRLPKGWGESNIDQETLDIIDGENNFRNVVIFTVKFPTIENWIFWHDFQDIIFWKCEFKLSELNLNYWLYFKKYARVIFQKEFLKKIYSKYGQISRFAFSDQIDSLCRVRYYIMWIHLEKISTSCKVRTVQSETV